MKNIIYLLILIGFSISCDNWMEVEPKGKIIPSKAADYRLLLDNTQNTYSSTPITITPDLTIYFTDDMDIRSDMYSSYGEKTMNAFKFADHIYLESEEDPSMEQSYSEIYVYNTVIDEVLNTLGDDDEKNQLYAEAKIHRAFIYLCLVNIYAKQYDSATANTDLGLPMQIKPELEGSLIRGTVQEVYDLIINDVNEVYDYLPDTPEQLWRPSKASATALLARTYLIMGDFDNALQYANTSLNLYFHLTDYNTLSAHPWYPSLLNFGLRALNKEQSLLKKPVSDYHLIYPSKEFLNLFDKTNDLRYTGKITTEFYAPATKLLYYFGYNSGSPYGLTVPEMLLTRAECYARTGDATKAMADINTLRKYRIKTTAFADLIAKNATEALSIVKDERRRELAFMGFRFTDLRRYNAYDNANISIFHKVDNEIFTLAPGDNKWVAPIANKYINKNPEIEQNPR